MAITINGSANTVAGLAVGGLPDGVVDADTLASNAVTNVKVADDAIGVAELSTTGTAGSGNYLRGDNAWTAVAEGGINKANIVKVSENTAFNTSSTSYVTCMQANITPATGSHVIIICQGAETVYRKTSTSTKPWHQIERGTALSGTSLFETATIWWGFTDANSCETGNRFYMQWIDMAPGGDGSTAITYNWNMKSEFTSSATVSSNYINQHAATNGRNMFLIEVK